MMLINPKHFPKALGTEQTLTIPKETNKGEWIVVVPTHDEDGDPIEDQHTHVFLKYADKSA
ncbi:MAG: hypothetical protein AAF810_04940 [Cyanobacteria bacterium P01_D01_bin.36]